MDEGLIEKKISSIRVYEGGLLKVNKDVVELPNGKQAVREWIEHPGAAAVVPLLNNGKIVMVRQYRHPMGKVTLEIPAGKLDGPHEDPLDCARRELKEETGYRAHTLIKLTTIATTVGFSNEVIHLYVAKDLDAGLQCPDEDEFINTVMISVDEIDELIQTGKIDDAKSVVSLLMVKNFIL